MLLISGFIPLTSIQVRDATTTYAPVDDAQDNSGFRLYPSPTVDACFERLYVATDDRAESQARYELHLACVRISATLCSGTLSWSPSTTPGSSDVVRSKKTTNKSLGGSFNFAQGGPTVGIAHTRSSTSEMEKDEKLSGIVVESGFTDDKSFVGWRYDIDDAKERKFGRDFRTQSPRVKFAFSEPTQRPRIGVRLIVTWSLASPPKNSWSSFLKKKTRSLPVFRNFLQDVSTSLQLDGLAGQSYIEDPTLSASSIARESQNPFGLSTPQNPSTPSTSRQNSSASSTAPQNAPTPPMAPQNSATLSPAPLTPSAPLAVPQIPSSPVGVPHRHSTPSIITHNPSGPGPGSGPPSMDNGLELQARATAVRKAFTHGRVEVLDVKGVFKLALYGCVRDPHSASRHIHTDSV